jgi:hypothetical protein
MRVVSILALLQDIERTKSMLLLQKKKKTKNATGGPEFCGFGCFSKRKEDVHIKAIVGVRSLDTEII